MILLPCFPKAIQRLIHLEQVTVCASLIMQDPFTHLSSDFFPAMLQKLLINTECIHIHPILHQRITFAFLPYFFRFTFSGFNAPV